MKILAIDASTKSSGLAIFECGTLTLHTCITATSDDLFKRIHKMVDEIKEYIKNFNIEKVVLEEVRPENGLANIKTHKALMYLQGAIAMMIHDTFPKTEIVYLYPSEWRKLCGIKTGSGVKRESLKAKDIAFVKEHFNITVNDDEADAISIGFAYVKQNGISWE